jgi:hypothetical protein
MAFLCVEYRVVLDDLNDFCERHFVPEASNHTPFFCFYQTNKHSPTHSLTLFLLLL